MGSSPIIRRDNRREPHIRVQPPEVGTPPVWQQNRPTNTERKPVSLASRMNGTASLGRSARRGGQFYVPTGDDIDEIMRS
jgi:hypothetical protein